MRFIFCLDDGSYWPHCPFKPYSMNLDDLFTITDYTKVGVDIPCFDEDNSGDDKQEKNLHIDIFCSTAASTDFDLTGQILWPVSILLSHYLASKQGQEIVKGRNVVELGAGCGLAGITAAYFCNQVVITDGEEVIMDLLKKNEECRDNITALPFWWGVRKDLNNIFDSLEHSVDVVVAADVVQWPTVVEPLLHSVKALLWNSRSERPSLVLGIVNRANNVNELFFEKAKELGFTWRKIPNESFVKDGIVPKACQEFGGRETQVFIVELADRSEKPTMLEEGADLISTKF